MNFKLPSRPCAFIHYVVKLMPCAECARDDDCNYFHKNCNNCNGEGYTLHLTPLTRSLVEQIIYEESER